MSYFGRPILQGTRYSSTYSNYYSYMYNQRYNYQQSQNYFHNPNLQRFYQSYNQQPFQNMQNYNYYNFSSRQYNNKNMTSAQNINNPRNNPQIKNDGIFNVNKNKRKRKITECHLEYKNKKVRYNEKRPLQQADKKVDEKETKCEIQLPRSPTKKHNAKFITKLQTEEKCSEVVYIIDSPVLAPQKIQIDKKNDEVQKTLYNKDDINNNVATKKSTTINNLRDEQQQIISFSTPFKSDKKGKELIFKSPEFRDKSIRFSTPIKDDIQNVSVDEGFNENVHIEKKTELPSDKNLKLNIPKLDKVSFMNVWLNDDEEEEEVNTSDLMQNVSLMVNVDDNTLCTSNLLNDLPPEEVKITPTKSRDVAIILDTYVFIYNLVVLEKILDLNIEESTIKPVIYMPWIVITQLDEIKDFGENVELKQSANAAIKFIYKALSANNPRFVGQNIQQEQEVINFIRPRKETDDKIIGTLKQAAKKYKHVLLLTNDGNLKSKAAMDNIHAYSPEEILPKIRSIMWAD